MLADVKQAIEREGLAFRGGFHPQPDDLPEGVSAKTLVLVGYAGGRRWPVFAASPEHGDGEPNALDRWSRRVVDGLAARFGAEALFPFGGPPWLPFQRWARKAETLFASPIGMQLHPQWGLWHSWRGALAFAERLELESPVAAPNPCDSCAGKPCLTGCPVGAFRGGGFDVQACASHLRSPEGVDCAHLGCLARRACPVGVDHRYSPAQSQFHLRAFAKAQG